MYLTLVWFFIITVLGNKEYMISSLCILACVSVNMAWIKLSVDAAIAGDYVERKEFLIMLEGATALSMAMFLKRDKVAWIQALLLCFGMLCHIMLILSIKSAHAGFFYNWYDELIIAVGLLQMMVSYDGFIHALSNVQVLLLRAYTYCNRNIKNLPTHKRSRERS